MRSWITGSGLAGTLLLAFTSVLGAQTYIPTAPGPVPLPLPAAPIAAFQATPLESSPLFLPELQPLSLQGWFDGRSAGDAPLHTYKPGSWGPTAGDELLSRYGHKWQRVCGSHEADGN